MVEIYGNVRQVVRDVHAPDPLAERMQDLRRESRRRSVLLIVALAALLISLFFSAQTARAVVPGDDVFYVTTLDFMDAHPDFNLPEDHRISGNVAAGLSIRPQWVGAGHEIAQEYRQFEGRPISPSVFHLSSVCSSPEDTAGAEGAPASGSVEAFSQWFRWIPHVNEALVLALPMTVYPDDGFGYARNDLDFHILGKDDISFTMSLRVQFEYEQCQDQSLAIESNGDVWIFIGGYLVIDHQQRGTVTPQMVDFDRLGLMDGHVYPLEIFYASRGRDSRFGFKVYNTQLTQPLIPVHPGATCD